MDADVGKITINPDAQTQQEFHAKLKRKKNILSKAKKRAHELSQTKKGKTINVFANIGRLEDTENAIANGADGIGLYRIEQIYLSLQKPPSPNELYE